MDEQTTDRPITRFDYVKYDEQATKIQQEFKNQFLLLENEVERNIVNGRAKSLVLTKLEEAYMWVGKAIRDEQIARGSQVGDVPERTNN